MPKQFNILYSSDDIKCLPSQAQPMPKSRHVLMVEPDYFSIQDVINPHMLDSYGQNNVIHHDTARKQWDSLRDVFEFLGLTVHITQGHTYLPDMVFVANPCLPYCDDKGTRWIFAGSMVHESRKPEPSLVQKALENLGYLVKRNWNPSGIPFEGMGDMLWVPGRQFALCGYGIRTQEGAYTALAKQLPSTVQMALIKLSNPRFYHLDTCVSVLDDKTLLVCKEAFSAPTLDLLKALFPRVIEVPLAEADSPQFACNAFCPDGTHVILQKGSEETEKALLAHGYKPIAVDTSQFIKAGGSVFCLKLSLF